MDKNSDSTEYDNLMKNKKEIIKKRKIIKNNLCETGGDVGNCYLFKGKLSNHIPPKILLIGPDYCFVCIAFIFIIIVNLFFIILQYIYKILKNSIIEKYYYSLIILIPIFILSLICQYLVVFSNPGYCELNLNQNEAKSIYKCESVRPCSIYYF